MDNIFPVHDQLIDRKVKEAYLQQKAGVYWLTGLSGSGKTTIAAAVEKRLFGEGYFTQVLDGDNLRNGLCKNLSFSMEDRAENTRRVAELSKLYINSGIICLNSFVSPTAEIRAFVEDIVGKDDFYEIYINTCLSFHG